MTFLQQIRTRKDTTNEYATCEDLCKVFSENLNGFYQLALLLTGDPEKAEQCFVAGLDDAAKSNNVFKDWARSWAKRVIIKNAIVALRPTPGAAYSPIPVPQKNSALGELLALAEFDRFVFVMSVLEGYSGQECALLLGCSLQDVRTARVRALEQLASSPEVLTEREPGRMNAESLAEEKSQEISGHHATLVA